jgi:tryptophanyl-tRNA synthetase
MNNQFGNVFTIPQPVPKQHEFFGKDQGLRIRDLIDPAKKMSKSDETGRGVIFLSDTPEVATKKIMSATTDSYGEIKLDMRERPGIANLLTILALLSGKQLQDVANEWEGKTSYGDLKKTVAEIVASFLTSFQSRLASIDEQTILSKLEQSETAMRQMSAETLLRAQQAVGLRQKD